MSSNSTLLFDLEHPNYAPFFGWQGVTAAIAFTSAGSSYGILKSGSKISMMFMHDSTKPMSYILPVIMSSIISIYGMITAIVLCGKIDYGDSYSLVESASHFAAGLTCGLCGLGSGYTIGMVSEIGIPSLAVQSKIFLGLILILIFAEVLGLYGLIVALLFIQ